MWVYSTVPSFHDSLKVDFGVLCIYHFGVGSIWIYLYQDHFAFKIFPKAGFRGYAWPRASSVFLLSPGLKSSDASKKEFLCSIIISIVDLSFNIHTRVIRPVGLLVYFGIFLGPWKRLGVCWLLNALAFIHLVTTSLPVWAALHFANKSFQIFTLFSCSDVTC